MAVVVVAVGVERALFHVRDAEVVVVEVGKVRHLVQVGQLELFHPVVVVVVEVKADVVVVRRGRIEGIRHRATGRLSPHLEHGEWGRRGRVDDGRVGEIMRIWEVTCPGGARDSARGARRLPRLRCAPIARDRVHRASGSRSARDGARRARSSRSRVPASLREPPQP